MNDYIVKYAAMPVTITKEWAKCLNENKQELEQYYVASRCYVFATSITFDEKGNEHWTYKVVFPHLNSSTFKYPEFNFEGRCTNTIEINEVYDEAELDILKEKNEIINRKLLSSKMYKTNYDREKITKLQEEFAKLQEEFQLYESQLEEEQKEKMSFKKSKILGLKK